MGIFSINKKQVTLIYNSETALGKQTYAYVNNSNRKIRSIDTANTKITSTQWAEIVEKSDIEIEKLVNKKHPDFNKLYSENIDLDAHDWMKVLEKHPHLVQFSILVKGTKFHLLSTPTDFLKFIDPVSVGVSRNPKK